MRSSEGNRRSRAALLLSAWCVATAWAAGQTPPDPLADLAVVDDDLPVISATLRPQSPAPARTSSMTDDAAFHGFVQPQLPTIAAQEPTPLPAPPNLPADLARKSPSSGALANPSTPGVVLPVGDAPTAIAPGATVGDILLRSPSVAPRRISPSNLDVRVRGFNAAQTNLSAGGVQQLRARMDLDPAFGNLAPSLVDRFTIIDGPYSSLYGPGFAFVAADLRAPERYARFGGGGSTSFGFEANGSQLWQRQNVQSGGPNWGVIASLGQRVGNDYTSGGDLFRIPASYNQWDGFLAGSFDLPGCQQLNVHFIQHELNDAELPGVAYDLRQSLNQQFDAKYAWLDPCDRAERLVLQGWHTRTRFSGDANAASKRTTMFGHLIGAPFGPYDFANLFGHGTQESTGARGYLRLGDAERAVLTVGADYRLERFGYRERYIDGAGAVGFGGNLFGVPISEASNFGAFANLSGRIGPSVEWTLGGRADATSTSASADDLVVASGNNAQFPTKTTVGDSEPGFGLGMGYFTAKRTFNDVWSGTVGVAYAMRAPGLAELYGDRMFSPIARFGNSFAVGDTNLRPERNLQFDLGTTANWCWGVTSLRVFHSTIDDYILPIPQAFGNSPIASVQGNGPFAVGRRIGTIAAADNASVGYVYSNVERATLFGGDASVEWRLMPWLSATGSLAYVKGANHAPRVVMADGSYGVKGAEGLPGIFPFTGGLGLRWFEPERERFGLEIAGRFVYRQDYVADSLGELPTDGYTVWNVRGWLRLGDRVSLQSAVKNVFNANYTQHGSLAIANPTTGDLLFVPEPGLSWVTSVEILY